jgi:hypothetical protein
MMLHVVSFKQISFEMILDLHVDRYGMHARTSCKVNLIQSPRV